MMPRLSFTLVGLCLLHLVLEACQEPIEVKQEQQHTAIQEAYAQVVYCQLLENTAIAAADSAWIEILFQVPSTEEGIELIGGYDELLTTLADARTANRAAVARLTGLLKKEGLIEFGLPGELDPERCESRPGGLRPARRFRPTP